jgi:hypothetical protein
MEYSLFLYPAVNHRGFSIPELEGLLRQQGLVQGTRSGALLPPGERLMEQINFLGCSPSLVSGEVDCSVLIHGFDTLTGLGGQPVETLRFPRCKHPIPDPVGLLQQTLDSTWHCAQCANQGKISDINWRKSAAYADCFIEISAIFPKEAVPNATLINALDVFAGCSWNWFYSASTIG